MNLQQLEIDIFQELKCPKQGEAYEDCQDACCYNLNNNRFAVADGVSSSFYPAIYSRLLTDYFCNSQDEINRNLFDEKHNWKKWLKNIQNSWVSNVAKKVELSNKYYVRNRFHANDHAGSTFVGIEIDQEANQLNWKAMIIGDSCLMHFSYNTQKEKLILNQTYPLTKSDEFNYTPPYFPSRPVKNNPYEPIFIEKEARINDRFILATDAISKWIFNAMEKKLKCLKNMFTIKEEHINLYRNDQECPMENDDVVMLGLTIIDSSKEKE